MIAYFLIAVSILIHSLFQTGAYAYDSSRELSGVRLTAEYMESSEGLCFVQWSSDGDIVGALHAFPVEAEAVIQAIQEAQAGVRREKNIKYGRFSLAILASFQGGQALTHYQNLFSPKEGSRAKGDSARKEARTRHAVSGMVLSTAAAVWTWFILWFAEAEKWLEVKDRRLADIGYSLSGDLDAWFVNPENLGMFVEVLDRASEIQVGDLSENPGVQTCQSALGL